MPRHLPAAPRAVDSGAALGRRPWGALDFGFGDPKRPRILIVRNDRLGDLVLALPVLRALRRAFPGAYLGWLASAYAAPLLQGDPDLDALLTGDGPELREGRFELALHLYATWRNAWAARRAGIPWNLGPSWRPFSMLYSHRLDIRRSRGERSEAEYNLEYLAPLGVEGRPEEARLHLGAADLDPARAWLRARGLRPGRFAALHPGTGGSAAPWPLAHYAALARKLRSLGLRVLYTGGPGEAGLLAELRRLHPAPALAGELPLRAFAALLSLARLFVSASTGPMHLAAAGGTPTLSFFPPFRAMSALRWHPVGNARAVLEPPGWGRALRGSAGRELAERAMAEISPQAAFQAARALLEVA